MNNHTVTLNLHVPSWFTETEHGKLFTWSQQGVFVFLHAKLSSPHLLLLTSTSASIYTLDSEDFCWKVGHMTNDVTSNMLRSHEKVWKIFFQNLLVRMLLCIIFIYLTAYSLKMNVTTWCHIKSNQIYSYGPNSQFTHYLSEL